MKPFGEFFEIMLNSCCAFLGVNNNDFFEFCFKTFHANHESRIRGEMDSLTIAILKNPVNNHQQ